MTPVQYHFPYFMDFARFNTELARQQWKAHRTTPQNRDEGEILLLEPLVTSNLESTWSAPLRFDFGTFLMVQSHLLFAWRRYEDGLLIRQYDLREADPESSLMEEFVEIISIDPGKHLHPTTLTYHHFVTFIRKPNLSVREDDHGRYVIVLLHEQMVNVIPFDSFNETGGDPLYMWPALATLDYEKGMLYGHGMRMGSFETRLDKDVLEWRIE